jgi:hypothetical protein
VGIGGEEDVATVAVVVRWVSHVIDGGCGLVVVDPPGSSGDAQFGDLPRPARFAALT